MAHHGEQGSPDPSDRDFMEMIKRQMEKQPRTGPTDRYPEGKLNDTDDGETRVAVGIEKDKIIMDFGEPTIWIGFTPEQALGIAELLVQHARAVAKRPLSIRL